MTRINPNLLSSVNNYRISIETEIVNFYSFLYSQKNINLYQTPNYRLFSLITENIRMNLVYLEVLNPETNFLGLTGLYRNIRNSIESYYDLFNLTCDESYFSVLKYYSNCLQHNEQDVNIIKTTYKNILTTNNGINKFINTKTKSRIAKEKFNLDPNIFDTLKEIGIESNKYVHPDIFVREDCIENTIKELVYIDCCLLKFSFDLIIHYAHRTTGYYSPLNTTDLLHQLNVFTIRTQPIIIN